MINHKKDNQFWRHDWQEYTRSCQVRYSSEIEHLGLKARRILKAYDKVILNRKVENQYEKWAYSWKAVQCKQHSNTLKEQNQAYAEEQTEEAKELLDRVDHLVLHALELEQIVHWEELKEKEKYDVPNPKEKYSAQINNIQIPAEPQYKKAPNPPNPEKFKPALSPMDRLFKFRGDKKRAEVRTRLEKANIQYDINIRQVEEENQMLLASYQQQVSEIEEYIAFLKSQCSEEIKLWKEDKKKYYKRQKAYNERIDILKQQYSTGEAIAVTEYCELVLNQSEYPDSFPKDFDLEYNFDNKHLVVEYVLPIPEQLPKLAEVKYDAAHKELKRYYFSEVQQAKQYDDAIYRITLRTLHELFKADQAGAVQYITFNGWVRNINKTTGRPINACIVTIQVNKEVFEGIRLATIDPKTCFRNLKGLSGTKLANITPVQPLVKIDQYDKRFLPSYNASDIPGEEYKLETMKWEDFERLIRVLFEQEFKSNALIIRWVPAERDSYGTALNERITKEILVTTSDSGQDTYVTGNNILYLLEKQGYKVGVESIGGGIHVDRFEKL